jgi:hypothetical protein
MNILSKKYTMVAGFIAGVVCMLPFAAHALTVSPARLEVSGDAGKVATSEIQLFNEEQSTSTYYFSTANFEAQGEGGTPNFVEGNTGLASWISVPESITLKAGEQVKIPFSIKIPDGTEPGGYFAGIFLSTTSPKSTDGGQVAIGAKVGVLVLMRVNGQVKESAGVLEFKTLEGGSVFTSLPVSLQYRFQNSGSDRVMPKGSITIKHVLGWISGTIDANPERGNVLPFGSTRKFIVSWDGSKNTGHETVEADPVDDFGFFDHALYEWKHFALGRYTAVLSIAYGEGDNHAKASTSFYVLPWHLLLVIILILLVLYLLIHIALKKYNHWVIMQAEQMLEREHGYTYNERPARDYQPIHRVKTAEEHHEISVAKKPRKTITRTTTTRRKKS